MQFMKKTGRQLVYAVITGIVICGSCSTPKEKTEPKSTFPNILLVLSDDQSVPHLGCYGNPDIKTPNLDAFSKEGIRMDRAYVSSPQCVPARVAIFTGMSAVKTNMTRFSAPLPENIKIFPEILREKGYFSGVAGRTYHMDGHAKIMAPETRDVFEANHLVTFNRRLDYVNEIFNHVGYHEKMVEFLDSVPEGKPWFLQLCFDDPHRPLDTLAIAEPHDPTKLTLPEKFPDTKLVREDFARYYDEISRMDGMFGQVLDILKKRNLDKNTIVVFMGDNGGAILRGKGTLYEYGLNVPMLIRWPGTVKPNSVCNKLVAAEDLSATFLDIAGIKKPEDMQGESLLPLLKGEPFEGHKYIYAQRGAHGYSLPNSTSEFDLSRCVLNERYKLIYNVLWELPFTPVDMRQLPVWTDLVERNKKGLLEEKYKRTFFQLPRPMFELYDLKNDNNEMNNLIDMPEYAAIQQELKAKLQERVILEHDFVPSPVPDLPEGKVYK